jgi:hypothetical protein
MLGLWRGLLSATLVRLRSLRLVLGRILAFSVKVVGVVCSAASTSLWFVIGRSHAITEVIGLIVCSATTSGRVFSRGSSGL